MSNTFDSLLQRVSRAESPRRCVDWEKKEDGYYVSMCRVSQEDVPGLIEIAVNWVDPDWPDDDSGLDDTDVEDIALCSVTAWRTLADLKSAESVEPLIRMLAELDGEFDDWSASDLPRVFGKIGETSINALIELANDDAMQDSSRSIAAEALQRVAEYHVAERHWVIACLTEMMNKATGDCINFNSSVMAGLVELRAVEAAEAIERAFAKNFIDVGMIGDWEDVRRRLGVKGLGLEMPKHPHSSIERFRRNVGIGIFSDCPIFLGGEIKADAEQAYYERAWQTFSASEEAQQVVDRFGGLSWVGMLLEFGIRHLCETVDKMSPASVHEFVLEYIPRKVSTQADRADSIVFELTRFFEYIDRVYELPPAKPIAEWLRADDLLHELREKLSNPDNFGMAKSFMMAGMRAGYDMTTEEGMARFTLDYNQSRQAASMPLPIRTDGGQRVRRNDPCPCGSGKKFKKCCR